jgi:hypothetical protein
MLAPAQAREEIAVLTPGGASVDVCGELIVIGDPGAIVGFENEAGEVHVYEQDGLGWRSQTTLTASDIDEYDNFGGSVAVDGDVIAVGAPANDLQFPHLGAVYVFRYTGGTWVEEARLDSGRTYQDNFGLAIDLEDDLLVVGNTNPGLVFVFRYDGGTWVEEAQLLGSDATGADSYGYSVSLSGNRMVVGGPSDDDMGVHTGSAFVFRREGTTWVEEDKLTAWDAMPDDHFGSAVAISGTHIVIGAPSDDNQGQDSGTAYAFELVGSVWQPRGLVEHPDVGGLDQFGRAVAIEGDQAVVGAVLHDPGTGVLGSGFLFIRHGDGWIPLDRLTPSGAGGGAHIGNSVALSGELSALAGDLGSSGYVYDVGGNIPAVSEWGMLALTLLMLCTGTILLRHTKHRYGEETHAPYC